MPDLDEELKNMDSEGSLNSDNANEAVNTDDLLSDAEIQRIANMNLDDIIEDVTSDSVSVEDLFGNSDNYNEAVSFDTESAEKPFKADEAADFKENDTNLDDVKDSSKTDYDTEKNASNEDVKESKKSKKKKKEKKEKKPKQDKKGFFGVLKDIFFESVEDESSDSPQEQTNTSSDEVIPDNPKDENERVLKEMYGKNGEAEQLKEKQTAPKKGFFAKFKYRYSQFKKKNEEEEKAEEAAEAAVLEEKQRVKEEKKQAKLEKKEQAKQEKAAKPKKVKKEKPKKEKKPKEPPKPEDILKIKPKSILLFLLLISGIIVLLCLLNTSFHYGFAINRANRYLGNDNYEKAYQQLSGLELNDKDKDIYRQISVIMYVQRQYDSYNNYMKMNKKTEALNSLVKGIEKYDLYIDEAKSLGVGDDVEAIKNLILTALKDDFKISEAEVKNLVKLSQDNFTQYYLKIETYGEA